jgi:hypothetical protein
MPAGKFTHVRIYRCKNGTHDVAWLVESDQLTLGDSFLRAVEIQTEVWCDHPGCGWHGPVAELELVHKALACWTR